MGTPRTRDTCMTVRYISLYEGCVHHGVLVQGVLLIVSPFLLVWLHEGHTWAPVWVKGGVKKDRFRVGYGFPQRGWGKKFNQGGVRVG